MTTYVPTTGVTNAFESILKEINQPTFHTTLIAAAAVGWRYYVFSSAVIEGIDALHWAIGELLKTELFTKHPFEVLVRGDLDDKDLVFELGVSWGTISDVRFVEAEDEGDFDCEWTGAETAPTTLPEETDRVQDSEDILNQMLVQFRKHTSVPFTSDLYKELIAATQNKYEPDEFDKLMFENFKDTLPRYVWPAMVLSPYGGATKQEQWLSQALQTPTATPMLITTPDSTYFSCINKMRVVFHFDA